VATTLDNTQLPSKAATQLPAARRFFAGAGDAAVALTLLHRFPGECHCATASADIVRLAQAYALTGDSSFAERCVAEIDTWLGNAVPMDRWTVAAGRDDALRLISWCWVLMLIREAAAPNNEWPARVLASIHGHAEHLHRALSQYCPPPTHLTTEALGLLYAGILFQECPESSAWRDAAVRVLAAECLIQVSAEGVHVEQSSWFHRLTIEVYLHFLLLAGRNGISLPPHVASAVQRMVEFLLAIRQPDGSIPAIGDSDGARVVTLSSRPAHDARDLFAIAAVTFGRSDFAWAAGELTPEVAWLTGMEGVRRFEGLQAAPPGNARSRVFPSGGYAVMTTGPDRDAHQMVIDVGPLGCSVSSGHGHADLLSIQCAIFGEPLIVDPGTPCCSGDSKWRDFFRSTAAHSTVIIDGESQAEASGPFGWKRRPRVRLREWHSTADFDFLDAEHDGYTRLQDPVTHRRRVIFIKPAYWILIDDLRGAARHDVELAFQFAPADVALGPHPWARATTCSGAVLWVSPFPSAPAQPTLKCGELSPIRGWLTAEMGRLRPAPMLIYSFAVALPWRIVTLLLPDRQGLPTPPAVRPLHDKGGLPNGFVFERPRRAVHFDDHAVLVEPA